MNPIRLAALVALPLCLCYGAGAVRPAAAAGSNPLLAPFDTPYGVPPFDRIQPEQFLPAFEVALRQHDAEVSAIADNSEPATFANTVAALFASGELLQNVTDIFENLVSANTNPVIQKTAEEIEPRLAAHQDALLLNPRLFDRVKAVTDRRSQWGLDAADAYLLERLYQSFVLNGALLPPEQQERLKAINQELASLAVKFDNNLLAETNAFRLVIDRQEDLAGLPDRVVATAAETAARDSLPGKWVFTTQKPSMIPFLQYARNRELRRQLYMAYTNRANHDDAHDNKAVLARMVELRAEKAKLLGFPTYAAYKLQTRMAGTPEKAFELLDSLWDKSLRVAKREAGELQQIVDREGGGFKLASWDWWYYAEKLRKAKYDLEEDEVRPYFPLERVREGLFLVANRLYGLTFTPLPDAPRPHPDVQAFAVRDADGSPRGILYLDCFPRASKQGGAWCLEYRRHHVAGGKEITPVTTVVGNLTPPAGDTPALLSMDDTATLFHEFGHALESLMSRNRYNTTYVAMDFVELPSQLMEHWAFNPEVLRLYARHYQTGQAIPEDLITRIAKSSLFNQGFDTTEYLAAALLDLGYHTLPAGQKVDVARFETDFFARRGLIPEIVSRYRSTYFAHITAEYDAGYYSYIWSAVLDDDAFSAFAKRGVFDKATSESFRKQILEKDGSADPLAMFKAFMGREPSVEPLLRERGLM